MGFDEEGKPRQLGRGGMGVTYQAFDPGLARRTVALKVISSLLLGNDPKARERFRREAGVAALLHHPHIAAVFDIGEERGEDYYVMEFIAGEDLHAGSSARAARRPRLASGRAGCPGARCSVRPGHHPPGHQAGQSHGRPPHRRARSPRWAAGQGRGFRPGQGTQGGQRIIPPSPR